jgi:hypothetical protein
MGRKLTKMVGGRRIAICTEQKRGPLIYALCKYDFAIAKVALIYRVRKRSIRISSRVRIANLINSKISVGVDLCVYPVQYCCHGLVPLMNRVFGHSLPSLHWADTWVCPYENSGFYLIHDPKSGKHKLVMLNCWERIVEMMQQRSPLLILG